MTQNWKSEKERPGDSLVSLSAINMIWKRLLRKRALFFSYSFSCVASEDRAIDRLLFVTQGRKWESGIKMTLQWKMWAWFAVIIFFSFSPLLERNTHSGNECWEIRMQRIRLMKYKTNKQTKTEKTGPYSWLFTCCKGKHLWYTNTGSAPSHKSPDKNIDEIYCQPWEVRYHETTIPSLGNLQVSLREECPESIVNDDDTCISKAFLVSQTHV